MKTSHLESRVRFSLNRFNVCHRLNNYNLLKLVLCMLAFCIKLQAQNTFYQDTFRISDKTFLAQTPKQWEIPELNDDIQQDTTWNYITMYRSPNNDCVAQIGIQIVPISRREVSKKEVRKFKKSCSVTDNRVSRFQGWKYDYRPAKIKGCRKCPRIKTRAYSFSLNNCYELNFVLIAQGTKTSVDKQLILFDEFKRGFITDNDVALYSFSDINVTKIASYDTIHVGNCLFDVPTPVGFTLTKKNGIPTKRRYTLESTNKCIDPFTIEVYMAFHDTAVASFVAATNALVKDTSVVYSHMGYGYSFSNEYEISTNRKIWVGPGKSILVQVKCQTLILTQDARNYYARMVREYADVISLANIGLTKTFIPPSTLTNPLPSKEPTLFQEKEPSLFQKKETPLLPKPKK